MVIFLCSRACFVCATNAVKSCYSWHLLLLLLLLTLLLYHMCSFCTQKDHYGRMRAYNVPIHGHEQYQTIGALCEVAGAENV